MATGSLEHKTTKNTIILNWVTLLPDDIFIEWGANLKVEQATQLE